MSYGAASAIEIDKKLRQDFRRRIKDYGDQAETSDPVLAVLFRTFAQQLEALYADTGEMRLALLDELMAGLGVERRSARPAQTVLRFVPNQGSQLIEAGAEVAGDADTGERLTFRTDVCVAVSAARIAFAATYQGGAMRLLGSIDMPEEFHKARPSLEAVPANLGPNPSIFIAVQDLPPTHLEFHSVFFELGPDARQLQDALEYEPWCLATSTGELSSCGVLRPRTLNAGVHGLSWLLEPQSAGAFGDQPLTRDAVGKALPAGFYGSRVFVLPKIPEDRQFVCQMPRGMEPPLSRIFGHDARVLFSRPRAWFRIALPENLPALHNDVSSVSLHAMTASNVDCLNQTIYFDRHGTSIPISREAGTPVHLVTPLSIVGESGIDYVPEFTPFSDSSVGRYSIQNGRLELHPARRPDSSSEAFATVRAWTTNGPTGNRVGPGRVHAFRNKGSYPGVRVTNLTAAAGGTGSEGYDQARARFTHALLSRDRLITREDVSAAVKAFDQRVAQARVQPRLARSENGLRRVEEVVIELRRADFVDSEIEGRIIADDLCRFLQARSLYDTRLSVTVDWR